VEWLLLGLYGGLFGSAALLVFGALRFYQLVRRMNGENMDSIYEHIEMSITAEIRKQDDRIQKRLLSASEPAGEARDTIRDGLRPGQSVHRR